jgi:hypothetical protein
MEEIYLLTLLLVVFAVAIFIIIQIPEVQDYILPPSGNYGDASGSKILSNNPVGSNNGSNNPNGSNVLLTGILSNDFNSTVIYLIKDLYNDGSVTPLTSNSNMNSLLSTYDKRRFLSYNQYDTLNNRITNAITNSNMYQTIKNVSDHAKLYILSNIPPINTSNYINLISIMMESSSINATLASNLNSFNTLTNVADKQNIYGNIYTHSANWYLNNLSNGLSNQNMLSNYITMINSYIAAQNFSNI